MSEQQMNQESVKLLENEDDDIRSIAGSECEWTVDTSSTNGGGEVETMQTLKLKMGTLRAELKALKAEQKCTEMKGNLEKSEIVAKLEAADQKARMVAQIEVTKAMEEMEARFSDKFVLLEKSMEKKQQKEIAELTYNDSFYSLNMEMQKHKEIAKRLSGILVHVIPLLPEDHQASAVAAVERAKSITPQDIQLILNSQTGSSTGAVPPMAPLLPTTDPNLANFFSAIGGRFPTNLNSQNSNLVGLPPAAAAAVVPPSIPPPLGALIPTTNGKTAAYAFKVTPGEPRTVVSFRSDASVGADIPKGMKHIGDLPHGDVVCAVTMAKDGSRVFTGGKGSVKMWDIRDRIAGGVSALLNSSSANSSSVVHTFPCLKDSYIRSCKLFSDASTLIVGGETKTICVLDVERGDVKKQLDCQSEACYALALSADCRLCYSCCSNGTVLIWDLQSGERIAQLEGHDDGASCVDLSGDGQKLWTGGLDNTVRCWDIRERQQLDKQTLDSQIFSLGCCPTDDWVAAGMEDQNIQILNTNRMSDKYLLQEHQSCVLSLKFAHSGKWFVSAGKDRVVNCWRTPYGYRLVKNKECSSVLSCDISADDRYLLTGSGDKKASLYELTF